MFSTRRRCTASSSAIKMVAAMALPAQSQLLSRIGALWRMPINALLNLDVLPHLQCAAIAHVDSHIQDDQQADICDPAMLFQNTGDETGRKTHQRDRECKAKNQDHRV